LLAWIESAAAVNYCDQHAGPGGLNRHHGLIHARVLANVGEGLAGRRRQRLDSRSRYGRVRATSMQVDGQPCWLRSDDGRQRRDQTGLVLELTADELPEPARLAQYLVLDLLVGDPPAISQRIHRLQHPVMQQPVVPAAFTSSGESRLPYHLMLAGTVQRLVYPPVLTGQRAQQEHGTRL
jgi:hypothetical protein